MTKYNSSLVFPWVGAVFQKQEYLNNVNTLRLNRIDITEWVTHPKHESKVECDLFQHDNLRPLGCSCMNSNARVTGFSGKKDLQDQE